MTRLLMLSFMLPLLCCAPKPEGRFTGYEYVKSGATAFPMENYKLYYGEDGRLLIDVNVRYDETRTVQAPDDLPGKIDSIVREYKLWRVKESYRTPFKILDGYSWHLYIDYEGNSIHSSGYHSWPRKGLWEGIEKINALLHETVEAAGGYEGVKY